MYGSVIAYDEQLTNRVTIIEEILASNDPIEDAGIKLALAQIKQSITDLEKRVQELSIAVNLLGTNEQLISLLQEEVK